MVFNKYYWTGKLSITPLDHACSWTPVKASQPVGGKGRCWHSGQAHSWDLAVASTIAGGRSLLHSLSRFTASAPGHRVSPLC